MQEYSDPLYDKANGHYHCSGGSTIHKKSCKELLMNASHIEKNRVRQMYEQYRLEIRASEVDYMVRAILFF